MTKLIPHPAQKPIIGNLHQLSGKPLIQTLMDYANELGPIYELKLLNRKLIIVSGLELIEELSNENKFRKVIAGAVGKLRVMTGDGLFTADNGSPNWHKAHNILLPGLSMQSMKGYFPIMLSMANKLINKWDQAEANKSELDVPEDMSRFTFDTIGLCGFDFDFQSFDSDSLHPFLQSMNYCLEETLRKSYKLPLTTLFEFKERKEFARAVALMNKTVDDVIKERRKVKAPEKNDFLNLMLNGLDKVSGDKLSDENIRYQVITFLIAGHETTGGLLGFALSQLINNPVFLQKAYDEVDKVLGGDLNRMPEYRNISELKYINQILKESLRLYPPVSVLRVSPYEDTLVGEYEIKKDEMVFMLLPSLHRQKAIWGEDAELFNPDHFSESAEAKRPAHAYKPFGNGMRACIGRQFAMVEATLALSMILQRYKFINHHQYHLKIKELLTIKPDHFKIKLDKRLGSDRKIIERKEESVQEMEQAPSLTISNQHQTPLLILFGSNMGTAEGIAQQLHSEAQHFGFNSRIASLDQNGLNLPDTGALLIVCSSYNGNPPDNAKQFVTDLNTLTGNKRYEQLKYSIMGCGNSDWKTFQAVPRLIDAKLTGMGAHKFYTCGEGDANGDFEADFEQWHKGLWHQLAKEFKLTEIQATADSPQQLLDLEYLDGEKINTIHLQSIGDFFTVLTNEELQVTELSGRSTRHIEVELPAGSKYRTGDHLGVMPRNSKTLVNRVAARFQVKPETVVRIRNKGLSAAHLPINEKISIANLLENFVDLQEVATRKQLRVMERLTICPPEKKRLQALLNDEEKGYVSYVFEAKRTLLDLLEEFPASELSFAAFLEILAPLKMRYYSISSSPMVLPHACSITVSVLNVPAIKGEGNYLGVCSNYLAGIKPGKEIQAVLKDPGDDFRLPQKLETPIIMIGPGTGYAPFRGFLQERKALINEGKKLGASLLLYGCRNSTYDYIYQDELLDFEKNGISRIIPAFSRENEHQKEYVQHKIMQYSDDIWQMISAGAIIYICGDGKRMEPDVHAAFKQLYMQKTEKGETEANAWMDQLKHDHRYVKDVWASA